jgi:hypothetical protein
MIRRLLAASPFLPRKVDAEDQENHTQSDPHCTLFAPDHSDNKEQQSDYKPE